MNFSEKTYCSLSVIDENQVNTDINQAVDEKTSSFLSVDDKHVLNVADADINQIVPIKYKFAIEDFAMGCANNWMPNEVQMQPDLNDWMTLTDDEKRLILLCLGFIGTAESLIANNIVHSVYRYVTNPECRQYLLRQGFEEALHTWTFMYITESLQIDQSVVFNMHKNVDVIKNKDEFAMKLTKSMSQQKIDTTTLDGIRDFIMNLVGYYVIVEGIYFYGGFPLLLWPSAHSNKMNGLATQIQLILRDESIHLSFGIDLINTIIDENPDVWTEEFQMRIFNIIVEAVRYEEDYLRYLLKTSVFGLDVEDVIETVKYFANRRLEKIRLPIAFDGAKHKLNTVASLMDVLQEQNFFERRVTSYRVDKLDF